MRWVSTFIANISSFLLIFYTDVFGITVEAVGIIMLKTRIVYAIIDSGDESTV